MKDTLCNFFALTEGNLEETKRELCRKYENWEITQNEFNQSIILTIKLSAVIKQVKLELGIGKENEEE